MQNDGRCRQDAVSVKRRDGEKLEVLEDDDETFWQRFGTFVEGEQGKWKGLRGGVEMEMKKSWW